VERSPALAALVEAVTEDELRFRLPGRGRTALRAFPCSSRGGRGWPISTLILDEAAHFVSETDGFQTAERVWAAMLPSTAQFGAAARVVVASTPYGQTGLFADLHGRAAAGELEGALAQRATTAEVNPTIAAEFLAAEEARDPDSFRAEYWPSSSALATPTSTSTGSSHLGHRSRRATPPPSGSRGSTRHSPAIPSAWHSSAAPTVSWWSARSGRFAPRATSAAW
jgi:hypothetical protein